MCFANSPIISSPLSSHLPNISNLSFTTWNINGINDKTIGNKLQTTDFSLGVKNSDIIILVETWSDEEPSLPGYKCFLNPTQKFRRSSGGRRSGGIAILYNRSKLDKNIFLVKQHSNYMWIKITKEVLSLDKDLFICGVYIPPANSKYFNSETLENLEADVSFFQNQGHVMLSGDFNARTGTYTDTVDKCGSKYLDDNTDHSLEYKTRKSFDNNLNTHGKCLLQLCKNLDLLILNGRTEGDSLGRPTCHRYNGTSVVDYTIVDQTLISKVDTFIINPVNYLSDHSQLFTRLKIQTKDDISNLHVTAPKLKLHLPPKYRWSSTSNEDFLSALTSDSIESQINTFNKTAFTPCSEHVEIALNQLNNIFTEAGKLSLPLKTFNHKNRKNKIIKKKWFDKECKINRVKLRKISNLKHRNPDKVESRDEYQNSLRDYKNLLRNKQSNYNQQMLTKLESSEDPHSFWNTLQSMDENEKINDIPPVTEAQWLKHFGNLHSDINPNQHQQDIIEQLQEHEKVTNSQSLLDKPVTDKELLKKSKTLKNKKSSADDRINNEMIRCSIKIPNMRLAILKLFNLILESKTFPTVWSNGIISPIFKSGDKFDPNNYRGICVSSCFGKLFCSILNTRLLTFLQLNKIIHPSQIGFLPGFRTADHVFTLKNIVDNEVTFKNKGKLYTCFVDFRKAFDSVWHVGLLEKLLRNDIGGKFYSIIKDMYSKTQCSVKIGQNKTMPFQYSRGVRQGCVLSPTLFNIYMNDLSQKIDENAFDFIQLPNNQKLSCLFYADDLILISKSPQGLQNSINTLSQFCDQWHLEVNLKKTKIMIFQKRQSKINTNLNILLNNNRIDIVNEYTYLGTKLSSTGKFTQAQESLKNKSINALYRIKGTVDFCKLSINTANKIYNSFILRTHTYIQF